LDADVGGGGNAMTCNCSAAKRGGGCGGGAAGRPPYAEVGHGGGGATAGSRRGRRPGRCAGGRVSTPVRLLWSALSLAVTVACTCAFTQPAWFVHRSTGDRLGLFNYCVRDPRASNAISGPTRTLWPPRYSAVVHCVFFFREIRVSNEIRVLLSETFT